MLTTLKEILRAAQAGSYAVPAFDCVEDLMVRTLFETCESLRAPAILMGLPGPDRDGNGWHDIPSLVELQRARPTACWRSVLVASCSRGEWSRS
jgi:fructose-bisphosphate aldolase class II